MRFRLFISIALCAFTACSIPAREDWKALANRDFPLKHYAFSCGGCDETDARRFLEMLPWRDIAGIFQDSLGIRMTWPGIEKGKSVPEIQLSAGLRRHSAVIPGFEWSDIEGQAHIIGSFYTQIQPNRNSISFAIAERRALLVGGQMGTSMDFYIQIFSPDLLKDHRIPNIAISFPRIKTVGFTLDRDRIIPYVAKEFAGELRTCLEKDPECRIFKR